MHYLLRALRAVTVEYQLVHGQGMSVEVPLVTLMALSPSLKPPATTIFLFSDSFSCPSLQSKVETNSHRFVLFLQFLIYLSHCFGIGVALVLISVYFKGSGALERSLFLTEFSQYWSNTT